MNKFVPLLLALLLFISACTGVVEPLEPPDSPVDTYSEITTVTTTVTTAAPETIETTTTTTAATTAPETTTIITTTTARATATVTTTTVATTTAATAATPPIAVSGVFRDDIAREILAFVNAERAAAGVHPLKWDDSFTITAKIRSVEIPIHFAADHKRPDGREWHTVIEEAGIDYGIIGENLAHGGCTREGAAWYTPKIVMESWMNSPSHKANIINKDFEVIGVGAYDLDGKRYYVQHFGKF